MATILLAPDAPTIALPTFVATKHSKCIGMKGAALTYRVPHGTYPLDYMRYTGYFPIEPEDEADAHFSSAASGSLAASLEPAFDSQAYRGLMRQDHPNERVAKGLRESLCAMAVQRLHASSEAYAQHKRTRGLS